MRTNVSAWIEDFRTQRTQTSLEVQHALDIKERLRTSVLPWRGQFSPQLIEHLLSRYSGSRVLDPFCGSGTVLYEAAAYQRFAVGVDINPAAVSLASFASYCRMPPKERIVAADRLHNRALKAFENYGSSVLKLDFCSRLPKEPFYACLLLTAFGDKKEIPVERALTALEQLRAKLLALPVGRYDLIALQGDARFIPYAEGAFDVAITSPPYINVFNYHQNYRPVMEALGEEPLGIAKAEIGSNRKHRQNRFLTVIQYCLDLSAVFDELWRLLSRDGHAIFVVGRSSNVRGVPFPNGELIAAIAELSGQFKMKEREERSFTNRFGERIWEDILSFRRVSAQGTSRGEAIARAVGARALEEAMERCSNVVIKQEIQDAYDRRTSIERSPRIS